MKKKNIDLNNPALAFITASDTSEREKDINILEEIKTPPEGFRLNERYVEIKTKRVQLVMQPSLYAKARAAAAAAGMSFNEYCHEALREKLENK